jgi:Protein of unknown function (DUF3303)
MKYMVAWKIAPQHVKAAAETFLQNGGKVPAGLRQIGRWHTCGSSSGWLLCEGDEAALSLHIAEWQHLLEFQVTPVFEEDAAAKTLATVFAK